MNLKEVAIVLAIIGIMSVAFFGAPTLIEQASLKNLREVSETSELTHTSSLTPVSAFEITNAQDGGIFEIPPSNIFQPIITWEAPNDQRDLYTFSIANNKASIVKKGALDITSATVKMYGSGEDVISLSTAQLPVSYLTKKELGIAPVVNSNAGKTKEQILLSMLSLKDSYLEPFILKGAKAITVPSGSVTLDSGLTQDILLTTIFGNANEKKTLGAADVTGLVQLTFIGEGQLEEAVGKQNLSKYSDYKFFTVSKRATTQVMRDVLAAKLLGASKTYSTITAAERELVDDVVQGVDYLEVTDTFVIPTKDSKLLYNKDNTAYFGSKSRIVRVK